MADFGFVGDAYTAPSIYQDAQECINWYPEIDQNKPGSIYVQELDTQQSRGVVALYPTPGLTLKFTLPTSPVRGVHSLSNGTLFAVAGNTAYSIDTNSNVTTLSTSLTTSTGPVSITDNGLAVYFADGQNRYYWTFGAAGITQVANSDGAFTGADVVDVVDNYVIYNRPGTQQWGATSALSTTSPQLSFSSKDGSPDNLVSLIVNSRTVYLLGAQTSEAWIDAGLFPFPFSRIPGSNSQFGCAAAFSVTSVGNSFAYLSKNEQGQGVVVLMNGYQPERISNHSVENSLAGKDLSGAIAFSYQREGHIFYVLHVPSADITWVYDLVTQMWHKWLSMDAYGLFHRHLSSCVASFNNQVLVGDYQSGNVYVLDFNSYTENGSPIRRVRRCPHLVADFQRMFFEELQIQFQPGVGLASGNGSDPQAMLRWSNDGGSTWSNEHWVSIGKMGAYRNRAIWRRLGWARDRVFEVAVSDPVNAVIVSANLKASGGAN